MKLLTKAYLASFVFAAIAPSALASVNVSTPSKGAEVTSPFALAANAPNCSSQVTSSIGFSIDSSTDTTIVKSSTVNAQVTASTGAHTLHVKAWGNEGAACDTDVAITVVAGNASTGSSSNATAAVSSDGITVSSPGTGASVTSPFVLDASAPTCSSQISSAMGYSLDSSADTTVVDKSSLAASISAAAGAHTVHVKAWGNEGASCDVDVPITITSSGAAAPANTSNAVNVSSPSNGASVSSPFNLAATASECASQAVASMGYSLDSSTSTSVVDSDSLNVEISAAAGSHTVHVKAWGNAGASCDTDVAVTVGGATGGSSNNPLVPGDAVSVSSIQSLGNWSAGNDSGGVGSSSGSTSVVGSPSLSGHARKFVTQYKDAGDERYSITFSDDTTSTNFLYDGWVYIASPSSGIANLEMDLNQVMPNGQTVIFGFQCDGYSGTWDYTVNEGSAEKPSDHWLNSSAKCNVRNWSTGTWHHVQVNYSRTDSGEVTYKAVWLDGAEQQINATVFSAFALGWGPTLSSNFQVDGLGSSGSSTIYLDNLTVYSW